MAAVDGLLCRRGAVMLCVGRACEWPERVPTWFKSAAMGCGLLAAPALVVFWCGSRLSDVATVAAVNGLLCRRGAVMLCVAPHLQLT